MCSIVEKQDPLGVILVKWRQLDLERCTACAHIHKVAATEHRWVCRSLVIAVHFVGNPLQVPEKGGQFPHSTISGRASPWLADSSKADVLCRIGSEQLLTDLPDSVLY